jgi:hypothetical protein
MAVCQHRRDEHQRQGADRAHQEHTANREQRLPRQGQGDCAQRQTCRSQPEDSTPSPGAHQPVPHHPGQDHAGRPGAEVQAGHGVGEIEFLPQRWHKRAQPAQEIVVDPQHAVHQPRQGVTAERQVVQRVSVAKP